MMKEWQRWRANVSHAAQIHGQQLFLVVYHQDRSAMLTIPYGLSHMPRHIGSFFVRH